MSERSAARRARRRWAKVLVGLAVFAFVLWIAFDNTDDVRVGYGLGEANASGLVIILVSAVAGMGIGWFLTHRGPRD